MPSPGSSFREYEFNAQQNALFRRLATTMKFVGYAFIASAAMYAIPTIVTLYSNDVVVALVKVGQVGLIVAAGVWTTRAAANMKSIVETEGNDMEHLMQAMGELNKLFTLGMVLIVIMIVLVGLAFLLSGIVASGL